MSTNLLHYQDNDTLYLVGGYGQNAAGDMVTFPLVSSVNLPALVDGVIHHKTRFRRQSPGPNRRWCSQPAENLSSSMTGSFTSLVAMFSWAAIAASKRLMKDHAQGLTDVSWRDPQTPPRWQ